MPWRFRWDECCEGALDISRHLPAHPNPDDPDGPPMRASGPIRAHFFQGFFETDDIDMARALMKRIEGMEHGPRLVSGPSMAAIPDIRPQWRVSSGPYAPGTPFADIYARLPFLPIDSDPDSEYDAFHDISAVANEG